MKAHTARFPSVPEQTTLTLAPAERERVLLALAEVELALGAEHRSVRTLAELLQALESA